MLRPLREALAALVGTSEKPDAGTSHENSSYHTWQGEGVFESNGVTSTPMRTPLKVGCGI